MVRAYGAMLPRLRAEEQLDAVHAAALGNVQYERRSRDRAMGELARRAEACPRRAMPATPAALAAVGIAVEELSAGPVDGPPAVARRAKGG